MLTLIRSIARRVVSIVAVSVLALGAGAGALAEDLFYREILRDGRIYVFTSEDEAGRFEQSGELRVAVTRAGAGPGGETVVGDSERALQLYFSRLGARQPEQQQQPPPRIEWRDGKTRVTTEHAYLEVSNRIQVLYTHELPDEAVQLAGTAAAGDSRGSFRIRRAKLKLEGWFWKPNQLTYEVQVNWPGASSANPTASLDDAQVGWDPAGKGRFRVLLGQLKVPFSRQGLTSTSNLSFVDRALVSNEYAHGRDIGVAVQGVVGSNRLEYRAGIFNGGGPNRTTNDNGSFQYVARLLWQPNGSQPMVHRAWVNGPLYMEGDSEGSKTPIYALGVAVQHNDLHGTTRGNDLKSTIAGLDGLFKYRGFYGTAECYWARRTPESGSAYGGGGCFAQASRMLNAARTLEAAIRYGRHEANDAIANDAVAEIRGAVSYYVRRPIVKFQADVGRIETQAGLRRGARRDVEVRVQAQFIF